MRLSSSTVSIGSSTSDGDLYVFFLYESRMVMMILALQVIYDFIKIKNNDNKKLYGKKRKKKQRLQMIRKNHEYKNRRNDERKL